jgi:hypothetical protein
MAAVDDGVYGFVCEGVLGVSSCSGKTIMCNLRALGELSSPLDGVAPLILGEKVWSFCGGGCLYSDGKPGDDEA